MPLSEDLVQWPSKRRTETSRNVTRIRQQQSDGTSEEALRAIRTRNSLDIQLYDWAKHRFEQEIDGAGFRRRLALFRLVNQATAIRWP